MPSQNTQKEAEKRTLEAARRAGPLFPHGDIEPFDEPDLKTKDGAGWIGVEVTKLVRPKEANGFGPLESESFHHQVVRQAEQYHRASGAPAADVIVYFFDEQRCKAENPEGWARLTTDKISKREQMARSLAEFVRKWYVPGVKPITFSQRNELPIGFEVIGIASPTRPWTSSESGNLSSVDQADLAAIIHRKNALLPKYRARVPESPIWLLIDSGLSITKGVPIPGAIDEWKFAFDFDKVLLFSGMDNKVFEIGSL